MQDDFSLNVPPLTHCLWIPSSKTGTLPLDSRVIHLNITGSVLPSNSYLPLSLHSTLKRLIQVYTNGDCQVYSLQGGRSLLVTSLYYPAYLHLVDHMIESMMQPLLPLSRDLSPRVTLGRWIPLNGYDVREMKQATPQVYNQLNQQLQDTSALSLDALLPFYTSEDGIKEDTIEWSVTLHASLVLIQLSLPRKQALAIMSMSTLQDKYDYQHDIMEALVQYVLKVWRKSRQLLKRERRRRNTVLMKRLKESPFADEWNGFEPLCVYQPDCMHGDACRYHHIQDASLLNWLKS